MKQEVLRLDRVAYLDQGVTELSHLSLTIFAGEIMGLVPVNDTGMQSLLRLLRQNLPIHYGYVYYRERLVNQWLHSNNSYNRISIISNQSGLADDLTVADNVFVLRQGFGKWVIRTSTLRQQLQPFLREIDVDISADAYARDLTTFQRFVVEIVKAVVAGDRLIILLDASTIVSDAELHKLREILRHYAAKGISFLYISQHYEEIRKLCDRAAFMLNGQIAKILRPADIGPDMINCFGVEAFEKMVLTQRERRTQSVAEVPVLSLRHLRYGTLRDLSLEIAPGECVVLQDLDNQILPDFLDILLHVKAPERGEVRVLDRPYTKGNGREIAVVQSMAASSMLFPDLSYLDNLCFTMDHRLPRIWANAKAKANIRREYTAWLGGEVFDKRIDELSQTEKYDLIYARMLLQRPKAVFCVQPFMQADVTQRMHIWRLLERLLEKQIAVVILAVNLADTLSLADRLLRVRDGCVAASYPRKAFGELPEDIPWHHLWNEENS